MSRTIQVKILLVGMPESGKSSLLQRLTLDDFSDEYKPTTSSDFSLQDFNVDDHLVSTQIWDIGGSTPIGKAFTKNLNGVVLVFDATLLRTTDNDGNELELDISLLEDAYNKVLSIPGASNETGPLFPFLIVMNKIDLLPQGENYDLSPIIRWLLTKNLVNPDTINIMACSAKTGFNVVEVFDTVIRSILTYTRLKEANGNLPIKQEIVDNIPDTISTVVTEDFSAVPSDNTSSAPRSRRGSRVGSRPSISSVSSSTNTLEINQDMSQGDKQVIPAKIVLVGAAQCGKTSLLSKFLDESKELSFSYEPTVGTDLRVKNMPVKDKTISLQLWDSAGNQGTYNIGRTIYKNADGAIFMHDITSRKSFEELNYHWDNFMKYANPEYIDDFPILLVGSKNDLVGVSVDQRPVPMEEVLNWCTAKRPGAPITYLEASSLQGIGVKDAFVCIADAVLENYLLSIEENNETGSVENSDYGYDQRLNGDIQDDEDIDADIDGSEAVFSNPFDDHEPDDDPEEESVIKPVDEDIDVDVAEIYDVINDSRDAEEEDQGAGKANRSHDENDAMQNGHQTKPSPKIVPRGMRGLNIEDDDVNSEDSDHVVLLPFTPDNMNRFADRRS